MIPYKDVRTLFILELWTAKLFFQVGVSSLGLSGRPRSVWGPPRLARVHAKLRPAPDDRNRLLPKSPRAPQRKQRTRTLQISSEYRSLETDSARHGVRDTFQLLSPTNFKCICYNPQWLFNANQGPRGSAP